jgi:hypothetical protein
MVAALLGVRFTLSRLGVTSPALGLILEILVGIVVYPPAALLVARGGARDLLLRVLDALRPTR